MKKIGILLITAIVIILFCFTGCDKYRRNKYTGTWEFTVLRYSNFDANSGSALTLDTIYHLGKISYGSAEDELSIEYTESNSVVLRVTRCGRLFKFPIENYSGNFYGVDTISLSIWRNESRGQIGESIYGLKISEK